MVRNRIVGKAVIYKALHKGDVNTRLTRAYRKPTVRIADPLRNVDLFDCKPVSLIAVFINENKCKTLARVPAGVIDENSGIHDV